MAWVIGTNVRSSLVNGDASRMFSAPWIGMSTCVQNQSSHNLQHLPSVSYCWKVVSVLESLGQRLVEITFKFLPCFSLNMCLQWVYKTNLNSILILYCNVLLQDKLQLLRCGIYIYWYSVELLNKTYCFYRFVWSFKMLMLRVPFPLSRFCKWRRDSVWGVDGTVLIPSPKLLWRVLTSLQTTLSTRDFNSDNLNTNSCRRNLYLYLADAG